MVRCQWWGVSQKADFAQLCKRTVFFLTLKVPNKSCPTRKTIRMLFGAPVPQGEVQRIWKLGVQEQMCAWKPSNGCLELGTGDRKKYLFQDTAQALWHQSGVEYLSEMKSTSKFCTLPRLAAVIVFKPFRSPPPPAKKLKWLEMFFLQKRANSQNSSWIDHFLSYLHTSEDHQLWIFF